MQSFGKAYKTAEKNNIEKITDNEKEVVGFTTLQLKKPLTPKAFHIWPDRLRGGNHNSKAKCGKILC